MQLTYAACLILSLTGLAILDWRYKLAFWHDHIRTLKVLGAGSLIFIIWDALGIALGIFLHGNGPYALPLRLAPQFPPEELLFIVLLCYTTLLVTRWTEQKWPNTHS